MESKNMNNEKTKEDIKKEFYMDSFKNKKLKIINSLVYIAIMILVIFIVFTKKETIPNKSNIIEILIVIIFILWTIFESALTRDVFEQVQKKKKSFEEKLQNYEKQLAEVKFIHDSIIKKQQESPFEEFESLLEKYKDKIESLEEKVLWTKTNLELIGY